MAVSTAEVRTAAWDAADKTGSTEEQKAEIAKAVANAIWAIVHPNKELWERTPRKP